MKIILIFFLMISTLLSICSKVAAQVLPIPPKLKAPITECLFCNIDGQKISIGSSNPPRNITELTVVGKPISEGLPSLFEPEDLMAIDLKYITPLYREDMLKTQIPELMRKSAYLAMSAMLEAAWAQKIDLFIHSAYRSYEVQCSVFSNKLKKQIAATGQTLESAIVDVNTRSALPGQSEHQLGSVADLVTFIPKYEVPEKPKYSGYAVEYEMQDTPAFKWLMDNGYKYGYALSYPYMKTLNGKDVPLNTANPRTGYIYEPWHWRYIGVKNALKFKNCGNYVLKEFLLKLAINPNFECLQTKGTASSINHSKIQSKK